MERISVLLPLILLGFAQVASFRAVPLTRTQRLMHESQSLVEEAQSLVEEAQSLVEEAQSLVEEPQSLVEEPQSLIEEPQSLIEEPQSLIAPRNTYQEMIAEEMEDELLVEGRMAFQNTDYPGAGANNHHTPRQPGRNN